MPIDRRSFLRTIGAGAGAATVLSSVPNRLAGAAGRSAPWRSPAARRSSYTPAGTIDLWVHETSTANALITTFIEEYQSTYPDVTVNLLAIPYADFETKSLNSTAANDGPDLVKLPSWSLPDWADKGLLVPIDAATLGMESDDELAGAFSEVVLSGVSFEDQLYALPVDYQNVMLFYNKQHFSDAGLDPEAPPATWEEVIELGEALTERDGDTVTRAGFIWWYTVPIWVYLEVDAMLAQLGGTVLNEDASGGNLSNDAGVQALAYYIDLSREHRIASFDLIAPTVIDAFANGSASMMVSGSFQGPGTATLTDGALSFEEGTLGAAPMPVFADAAADVTSAYSWGWGITNNANDPQLAGHFARFLTEVEQADRFFEGAGIATPYSGFESAGAASANPGNEILVAQVPKSVYPVQTPNFAGVMTQLSDQIQTAVTGTASAEQVAESFDNAMRRVLR